MFFDGWYGLARVLIAGVCAYVALVALLRVSGKRTLSKMNAFDLIVTVALGSTLATLILSKDIAILEGLLAFALLVVLQLAVTWSAVRWPAVQRVVKSEPRLLFRDGKFLEGAMRGERVTHEEAEAAMRESGLGSTAEVSAMILETDGSISVISKAGATT